MVVPKLGRAKIAKVVSLLAVFALAGIGYSGFGSNEDLGEMLSETDVVLESLADPILEEIFQDKYHRALEAYTESKGLFACDENCQFHKRRLDIVDRKLNAIQAERAAARKALLIRAREQRLADTQARMAANAARRTFSHITSEERISVRRTERKAARDAERAAEIAALRDSLGVGPPLTLEEKQARAAAAKEARIVARTSRKTPAEAAAEAEARQAARWLQYLDTVAQAHCHDSWAEVEAILDLTPEERQSIRGGHPVEGGIHEVRSSVRETARRACRVTEAPTSAPTVTPTSAPTPKPTNSPIGPVCNLGQIGGELRATHLTPSGGNLYCLRLMLNTPTGSELYQGVPDRDCTTFTPTLLIGTTTQDPGVSPDLDLFNGVGTHCPGGRARSGDVTLVLDESATGISMVATEPYVCHYTFTVTYPSCVELASLYPRYD